MTAALVDVTVEITNTYEGGREVKVVETITVPPPLDYEDDLFDWADAHLWELTGTGHTEGDAWYDLIITASSDADLVGRTFAFGY